MIFFTSKFRIYIVIIDRESVGVTYVERWWIAAKDFEDALEQARKIELELKGKIVEVKQRKRYRGRIDGFAFGDAVISEIAGNL